ncbi:LamG domain-containing protein [Paenibacillus odorifer]|uniref:LamG domain-containing protein n=1 Tax=Paenibacillus odorifer TaxID=189426 RepID=UPI00096E4A63|nr:LamG domain-containing protein [Paenibacillus odorifer]OMD71241.1 hypothetical protein BSK50_26545 [Paenibacillus odorifer]
MPNTKDNMNRCGVAWFKMDEASGDVTDSKGSLIGTQTNVTRVDGVSGRALNFSGNGIVQFQNTIIPLGKKSIRFKVKTTQATTTGGVILSNGLVASGSVAYGYYFGVHKNKLLIIYYRGNVEVLRTDIYSNKSINDGVWHDILFTWDGTTNPDAVKLYIDDMNTPDITATFPTLDISPHSMNLTMGRTNNTGYYEYFNGQLDDVEIYNDVITPIRNRTLVFHNDNYKYYTTSWKILGSTVSESDYITYGIKDISSISEMAWSELVGEVQLCQFTDDSGTTETQFNIETEPFTLAEEWADKTIKVIEYTDNPIQIESLITLETEPFSLYDELGDSVDVLYYTDDPTKTKAELNVTANYSPLDDIQSDFEVVTWTNDENDEASRSLEIKALPFAQLILTPNDIKTYGNIKSFVASKIDQTIDGTLRFIVSFDSGITWKISRFGKWESVAIDDLDSIKKRGMSLTSINSLPAASIVGINRIGYYIDNSKHRNEDVKLDYLKIISNAPVNDVKFNDLAFYLLNTTATIQLSLQGNKLVGKLDDADTGRVQYRVSLNNKPYYPANGEFTALAPSPLNISFNISERDIIFDQENVLKVEFQDYWGLTDFWQTTFIGTYSGIMFKDESGKFYSNSFGEVLKQLDFGDLIAGQSTLEQKVIVKNQLGVKVQNLILEVMKDRLPEGVKIELSRSNFPFTPEEPLLFNMFFDENEEFNFYVRIVTELTAPASPNGQFEIRAKADSV